MGLKGQVWNLGSRRRFSYSPLNVDHRNSFQSPCVKDGEKWRDTDMEVLWEAKSSPTRIFHALAKHTNFA